MGETDLAKAFLVSSNRYHAAGASNSYSWDLGRNLKVECSGCTLLGIALRAATTADTTLLGFAFAFVWPPRECVIKGNLTL